MTAMRGYAHGTSSRLNGDSACLRLPLNSGVPHVFIFPGQSDEQCLRAADRRWTKPHTHGVTQVAMERVKAVASFSAARAESAT